MCYDKSNVFLRWLCILFDLFLLPQWLKSTLRVYNANNLQVFQQLDEGHQKQQEELSQELLEVKVNQICTTQSYKLW